MNKFEQILRVKLEDLRDEDYGDFVFRGVPGIAREKILGVRVPEVRNVTDYALGEIFGKKSWNGVEVERGKADGRELYREMNNFLEDLPHFYREYNHAHVEIIYQVNDFDECVRLLDKFLPYVDNWEISDGINPKIFKKHPEEVLMLARRWMRSEHEFTQRVGILMMMKHFLDERFLSDFLEEVVEAAGESEKYYVQMMVAWYLATALSKQWEAAIEILTEERLPILVHNKAISKAVESRRISAEQKDFLRGLRR